MPDNRDQSRQKRSKENRANRAAVEARKATVAKKAEPVEDTSGKGQRKTRAQAAPVRGSSRTGGAASAQGESTKAAPGSRPARPAPAERPVPEGAGWFTRVRAHPGGLFVLLSVALAIAVTVIMLVMPAPTALERWDSRLPGRKIEGCLTPKFKKVELHGKSAVVVCGPQDTSTKDRKLDTRHLAKIKAQMLDVPGPSSLVYLGIPILATAVAASVADRSNRRRLWGYATAFFGIWFVTVGLRFPIYIVPFALLGWGWWQARKADPPVRPERGAGGGGLGGLFGGGRRGGGADVIDADVVDESGGTPES